jgi:hypothetical protein
LTGVDDPAERVGGTTGRGGLVRGARVDIVSADVRQIARVVAVVDAIARDGAVTVPAPVHDIRRRDDLRRGDGPAVCCSTGSRRRLFARVHPLLAGRFRVIVPDLLGAGDSAQPEARPPHPAQAAYVLELLAPDVERFAVVGRRRRIAQLLALGGPASMPWSCSIHRLRSMASGGRAEAGPGRRFDDH